MRYGDKINTIEVYMWYTIEWYINWKIEIFQQSLISSRQNGWAMKMKNFIISNFITEISRLMNIFIWYDLREFEEIDWVWVWVMLMKIVLLQSIYDALSNDIWNEKLKISRKRSSSIGKMVERWKGKVSSFLILLHK